VGKSAVTNCILFCQ